jgi:putative ABC transport system substrate-binding protein
VRAAVCARDKASMTRAAAWLEELGLGQYAQVFAKQSTAVISDLTEVDLEKPGIPFGHRKRMLKAIGTLAGANRAADTDQATIAPPHSSPERRQLTMPFLRSRGLNGVRNSLALGRNVPAETARPRPRGDRMRRREFITALSGAVAWPLAVRAQQPAMPVIGFLSSASLNQDAGRLRGFRQGLSEAGYVEGRNVAIEYRWAEEQTDRLPALAANLVRRQVAVIAQAGQVLGAFAAKAATTTIPIVFLTGGDPVALGLVASLNRPGGNLTGVTTLSAELEPKRLELLRGLVPTATTIGALVNRTNPNAETQSRDLQAAARTLGLELHILNANSENDFDTVFARLAELRASGLVIATDGLFISRSEHLAALAVRHAVPAIFQFRAFAAAGGLMSYGGNLAELYRLSGIYTGRILKGEKPADLPVQQSTKAELIINMKTAKALGIEVPPTLSARADEVIE